MTKYYKIFLSLCLTICVSSVLAQDSLQHISSLPLKNMYRIDTDLYRSEQPEAEDFVHLQTFGITEVLNLRNYHDDTDLYTGSDITLYRVKMNAHHIKDEDVIEALTIIKNRKGPLVFHCKHGSDRTGVVCAMYRIVFQGWTKEAALQELKDDKLGYHDVFFNIPTYIEKVDVEKIKSALRI